MFCIIETCCNVLWAIGPLLLRIFQGDFDEVVECCRSLDWKATCKKKAESLFEPFQLGFSGLFSAPFGPMHFASHRCSARVSNGFKLKGPLLVRPCHAHSHSTCPSHHDWLTAFAASKCYVSYHVISNESNMSNVHHLSHSTHQCCLLPSGSKHLQKGFFMAQNPVTSSHL